MANDGAVARLSGRFPPGTKVGLYRGLIDTVGSDPGLKAAFKTATVGDDGTVEFTGLDDDERLFIAGYVEETRPLGGGQWTTVPYWRSVAIHASIPVAAAKPDSAEKIRTALASTLSAHELDPDRTEVGARNSRSRSRGGQPFAHEQTGKPTEGGAPNEPVPHLRQEDARDVEQRSATFTGQATPVDPKEQVPKPRQDGDVKLEQRSATGAGELTPIPSGEVTPQAPQSPDGVDLEQRSATPHGAQVPVPQDGPVENQRRKESSQAKAEGAVVPSRKLSQRTQPKKQARKASAKPAARKRPARTEAQKAARRNRAAAKKANR